MSTSFETKVRAKTDELADVLIQKNKQYGDSAFNPVRIFSNADPVEQLRVRIDDKISRIVKGEGKETEDVLLDLTGYLILLWVALDDQESVC